MQSCTNLCKTVIFRFLRASTGARRILTFVAAILGVLSSIAPAWAAATTVSLTTAGTLQVDRAGNLTADLANCLPSSGFFDVYQGTFSASATNVPAISVTQAYANALFGRSSLITPLLLAGNNLPTTSASLSNELVLEGEHLPRPLPGLSSWLGLVSALPVLDQNSYATLVAANIAQYCSIPVAVRDEPASPMPAHATASPASRSNIGFELEGPELV
jgi:hypothetical protein